MRPRLCGGAAAARRSIQEADLQQVGFTDFFDCVWLLSECRRQCIQSHRPAFVIIDDREEQAAIEIVETYPIDAESLESLARDRDLDDSLSGNGGKVTQPSKQSQRDSGSPAGPRCDLYGGFIGNSHIESLRGALDDQPQILGRVEIQALYDTEAIAKRRAQQAGPGRRSHQSEGRQFEPNGTGSRTLSNGQIDCEVLHRRVENFLDSCSETMNLVDEEYVSRFDVSQDRREISRPENRRSGRRTKPAAHLLRNDVRQRRLSESWGAGEQDMIEGFPAESRGFDVDAQVLDESPLTHIVGDPPRPKGQLMLQVVGSRACSYDAIVVVRISNHRRLMRWSVERMTPARSRSAPSRRTVRTDSSASVRR